MNTLSWRTPTTPMPMEINPRKVFERMFGQGGSAGGAARAHRRRTAASSTRSRRQATGLQRSLGAHDRATVDDYLESVREIERRIQRAEHEQQDADIDAAGGARRAFRSPSKSTSS